MTYYKTWNRAVVCFEGVALVAMIGALYALTCVFIEAFARL